MIGDECHIAARSPGGPRFDARKSQAQIDDYDNLILLCKSDHKLIDDQIESYPVSKLNDIKSKHEAWAESLADTALSSNISVRVERASDSTPLIRLESGRAILDIVSGAYAFYLDYDNTLTGEDADLAVSLLEDAKEWAEVGLDGPRMRADAARSLEEQRLKLEVRGLWVFGKREVQQLVDRHGARSPWPAAHLLIVGKGNPSIFTMRTNDDGTESYAEP